MQLLSLLPLTLLTLTTTASPLAAEPGISLNPRQMANNFCGGSSFVDHAGTPNNQAALVADCQVLEQETYSYGSVYYAYPGNNYYVLASYGTCNFYAYSTGGTVPMGNQDVGDLVRDSIKQFGSSQYMAVSGQAEYVSGETPCGASANSDEQTTVVEWIVGP